YGGIDASQAVLVAEMAKLQARLQGGTEDFVVTREFREMSTMEQRVALLRCCFAVEAADGTITADEASVVNEIARELDVDAETLNEVRAAFHDQLSSVHALRRATGGEAPRELREEVGVVCDAVAQLHRQVVLPRTLRQVDDDTCLTRALAEQGADLLHRADEPLGAGRRAEMDVEDPTRGRLHW